MAVDGLVWAVAGVRKGQGRISKKEEKTIVGEMVGHKREVIESGRSSGATIIEDPGGEGGQNPRSGGAKRG